MVVAAAAADGVALDEAETGGGLAGVYDARCGDLRFEIRRFGVAGVGACGCCGYVVGGDGGDAGEALGEVEGYALGLQDGLGGAFDGGEDGASGEGFAVVNGEASGDGRVSERHRGGEDVFAAEDAVFASG